MGIRAQSDLSTPLGSPGMPCWVQGASVHKGDRYPRNDGECARRQ